MEGLGLNGLVSVVVEEDSNVACEQSANMSQESKLLHQQAGTRSGSIDGLGRLHMHGVKCSQCIEDECLVVFEVGDE